MSSLSACLYHAVLGCETLQIKVKVKVAFLYSTAYAITGQERFTILEVADDWQEPMVLQCKLRPSIARVNVQRDPQYAASKLTTTLTTTPGLHP